MALLCLVGILSSTPNIKATAIKHDVYTYSCFKAITPSSWTGQTTYGANGTSPTLLLQVGTYKVRFLRLDISQDTPVAGGLIYCVIKLDTSNRYSSGGNAWVTRAIGQAATVSPSFTIYDTPTATNENTGSSNPITIFSGTIFQTITGLGTGFVYDFPDYAFIGDSTGTLLIYLYAASTGPTFRGTLTVTE